MLFTFGGFTHVCGLLLKGESAGRRIDERTSRWDEGAVFAVTPGLRVSFREDIHLMEDNFPLPVLQLEFSANIPWVLDRENTYAYKII